MRLFFGSYVPPLVMRRVQELSPWLKTLPAKLVEIQNLHLTLVFIGEVALDQVARLCKIGEKVATNISRAKITLGNFQLIPSATNPRVLAVHTKVDINFTKLQKNLVKELKTLKLNQLSAKTPHFTLARVKTPISLPNIHFKPLTFEINEFSLIHSVLSDYGPSYKALKTFKIGSRDALKRYRPNVSICLVNSENKVFLIERSKSPGHWQLPQGGIDGDEKIETAGIREISEEAGVASIRLLKVSETKYHYNFPKSIVKTDDYIGQEQTPVYLRFTGTDSEIKLNPKEAMNYKWVTIEDLVEAVFPLRRKFTQLVKNELTKLLA
ncbi:MAG: RNA 2',3'-cyclic phosphodiesterase [Patescibacteria group bacterium]